jgi:uncharacterized protein (TIGR03435 family)
MNPAAMMSGGMRVGMTVDGSRVDIRFLSMADLIRTAYKIKPHQLSGIETGIGVDRWDIQAKMPEGATKEQVPEMLQALLADRFKLKIHRDSKEQSVYALVAAKGGAKLQESEPEKPPAEDAPKVPGNQISVTQDSKGAVFRTGAGGSTRMTMGPNGVMHMETEKMTMEAFAEMLTGFLDRPVVDMTGFKGNYKLGLDLSTEDIRNAARKAGMALPTAPPAAAAGGAGGGVPEAAEPTSSIFSAIQQLGLKLDARKAPIEIIVVDHHEKTPTEN